MNLPNISFDTHHSDIPSLPFHPPPAQTDQELRVKFIDDQTQAEVVRLDQCLAKSRDHMGPHNFHDRHGFVIPPGNSLLQGRLNDLKVYTEAHEMKINPNKSGVMPFNFSRNYDFTPTLSYDSKPIDVIYK